MLNNRGHPPKVDGGGQSTQLQDVGNRLPVYLPIHHSKTNS